MQTPELQDDNFTIEFCYALCAPKQIHKAHTNKTIIFNFWTGDEKKFPTGQANSTLELEKRILH